MSAPILFSSAAVPLRCRRMELDQWTPPEPLGRCPVNSVSRFPIRTPVRSSSSTTRPSRYFFIVRATAWSANRAAERISSSNPVVILVLHSPLLGQRRLRGTPWTSMGPQPKFSTLDQAAVPAAPRRPLQRVRQQPAPSTPPGLGGPTSNCPGSSNLAPQFTEQLDDAASKTGLAHV